MSKTIFVAFLLFSRAGAFGSESDCPTVLPPAADLTSALSSINDRETFERYWDLNSDSGMSQKWSCFLKAIKRADEKYIAVLESMTSKPYWGIYPDLDESLSLALVKRPEAVLHIIATSADTNKEAERVCRPYLAAESPGKDWSRLITVQRNAVRSVQARELEAVKTTCLDSLRKVESDVRR